MAHTAERLSKAVATARATAARLRKTDEGAQIQRRTFQGIDLAIDRPKGFVQRGTAKDGTPWERTYLYDYGEIPGTDGGDGEGLDVFVGEDEAAPNAYWMIQTKDDGTFDEYKVMLGFADGGAAREAYVAHIPERVLGGMAMTSVEMIKALIGLAPVEVMKRLARERALEELAVVLDAAEAEATRKADAGAPGGMVDLPPAGRLPEEVGAVDEHKPEEKAVPEPYSDIDFTPPQGVRDRLKRGLELHEQGHSGDGLQADTVAWATRMAGGENVSPEKARQMRAWFERHEVDKKPGWDDPPTPGYVAWLLWGGDDGRAWAGKLVEQMDARDREAEQKFAAPDRTADVVAVGKAAAPGNDNAEERYVLGIVLKPEEVDLQGDIYSAEEIRKTAHLWLARYRNTDRQHRELINPLLDIVESYIAPVEMTIGEKVVKAGTWLLAVVVTDDGLWKQIKGGELTGFSIRGWSKKTLLAAA